jgi:2-polyprenyl-3-methyl-5-hydroxy-6-metoxy-1,4-benzoquinol methylase
MLDIPYAAPVVTIDRVQAIASGFDNSGFATAFLENAMRQLQTSGSNWLPILVLTAAQRLGRTAEFLPIFENLLGWMDAQSRPDIHKDYSDRSLNGDLLTQSCRFGANEENFQKEFRRIISHLAPARDRPVLDIGCAGGLWAISLAKDGFDVIGTDHHAGIIGAAQQNAKDTGLEAKLKFFVDDAQQSNLAPAYYSARVICISVTLCLPDNKAFESLIAHLDMVSRPGGLASDRRVILGHNRWGPSRISAVQEILLASAGNYAAMANRLLVLANTWWMFPRHIDIIRKWFPTVTHIGEVAEKIDGVRVDFLLQ